MCKEPATHRRLHLSPRTHGYPPRTADLRPPARKTREYIPLVPAVPGPIPIGGERDERTQR